MLLKQETVTADTSVFRKRDDPARLVERRPILLPPEQFDVATVEERVSRYVRKRQEESALSTSLLDQF